jgi:hypothetical protein
LTGGTAPVPSSILLVMLANRSSSPSSPRRGLPGCRGLRRSWQRALPGAGLRSARGAGDYLASAGGSTTLVPEP